MVTPFYWQWLDRRRGAGEDAPYRGLVICRGNLNQNVAHGVATKIGQLIIPAISERFR